MTGWAVHLIQDTETQERDEKTARAFFEWLKENMKNDGPNDPKVRVQLVHDELLIDEFTSP